MQFIVEQPGYGVLVDGGIGLVVGGCLSHAHRKGWVAESLRWAQRKVWNRMHAQGTVLRTLSHLSREKSLNDRDAK
jgi:hypothetical protein